MRGEVERALACRLGPLQVFGRRVVILKEKRAAVGNPGVCERVPGVELDSLVEHLARKLHPTPPMLVKKLSATKIEFIRLHVSGRNLFDCTLLIFGENEAQGGNDARGDFVLDLEDVLELAVVAFCPKLRIVS